MCVCVYIHISSTLLYLKFSKLKKKKKEEEIVNILNSIYILVCLPTWTEVQTYKWEKIKWDKNVVQMQKWGLHGHWDDYSLFIYDSFVVVYFGFNICRASAWFLHSSLNPSNNFASLMFFMWCLLLCQLFLVGVSTASQCIFFCQLKLFVSVCVCVCVSFQFFGWGY